MLKKIFISVGQYFLFLKMVFRKPEKWKIFYSCFKMSLFCFMISSIAAFNGYHAKGGSLGVGRSSTQAIVTVSILILLMDLIVTQLMLY